MLGLGSSLSTSAAIDTFLPTEISNLSLWFKNGTGVAVGQWDDSSGNDNHMTQSTSGNQAAVTGGEGGLLFTGSEDDHYDLATTVTTSSQEGLSCFLVCKLTSHANNNTILSTEDVDHFLEFKNGGDVMRIKLGGTQNTVDPDGNSQFDSGAQFLVTVVREAGATGNILLYKNGTLLSQSSQQANTGDAEFDAVGWGRSARTFNGIMHELLFYEAALSGDDLSNVHSYLRGKFGL